MERRCVISPRTHSAVSHEWGLHLYLSLINSRKQRRKKAGELSKSNCHDKHLQQFGWMEMPDTSMSIRESGFFCLSVTTAHVHLASPSRLQSMICTLSEPGTPLPLVRREEAPCQTASKIHLRTDA